MCFQPGPLVQLSTRSCRVIVGVQAIASVILAIAVQSILLMRGAWIFPCYIIGPKSFKSKLFIKKTHCYVVSYGCYTLEKLRGGWACLSIFMQSPNPSMVPSAWKNHCLYSLQWDSCEFSSRYSIQFKPKCT